MATTQNKLEKTAGGPEASNASLQVADVIIVSVDTRGLNLARRLAQSGWKTVVIELSGSSFNSEIEWADRLGPFQSWEAEGGDEYAAFWLPSGPVTFGGKRAEAGREHLAIRYDVLEQDWPEALARSLVDSRLTRREAYSGSASNHLRLPLEKAIGGAPVGSAGAKFSAEAQARIRRESATSAGVRILSAEQIAAVRLSDGRVDRIEFYTAEGLFIERTRSLVWMLSEEESRRVEFVGPDVPVDEFVIAGKSEPLMAWWRNRLAVRGLKNASSQALQRAPKTPPHVVVIGSIDRPWTHENLVLLDVVEENPTMRVFDVWTRIPYWARIDHVYRDEQRMLIQNLLADRFIGCELIWVTPSPLALTAPAIRMPHVVYSEVSTAARGRLENICFAGPETWPGVGLQGLRAMEETWLAELEAMRIQWDPVARLKASRMDRFKYAFRKTLKRGSSIGRGGKQNEEVSP